MIERRLGPKMSKGVREITNRSFFGQSLGGEVFLVVRVCLDLTRTKEKITTKQLTKEGAISDLPVPFRHFGANPPLYYASKAKMKGDEDVEKERKHTLLVSRDEGKWKRKKTIDGISCLKVPLAALSNKNGSQVWIEHKSSKPLDVRIGCGGKGWLCKEKGDVWCLGSLGKEGCAMSIFYRIMDVYRERTCKEQLWMCQ